MIENAQASRAEKQGTHDGCAVYKACVKGREEVLKTDRVIVLDVRELVRIDCARFIGGKLSVRHYIGKYSYQDHDNEHYHENVRHLKAFLFLF